MAPLAFLNLLALSSIAILSTAFSASPVSALSLEHSHAGRSFHHPHGALVAKKKKRDSAKCKPRSSSSAAPASTASPTQSSSSDSQPSQAPAPSASPAPAPPSGGNGQVAGISWANGEEQILPQIVTPKIGWYYNWSPQKVDSDMAGLEFIPQYWGTKFNDVWLSTVVKGYATRAFFLNEPDQTGQGDILDAQTAVGLWWQYMEPLNDLGYELIGAAPTNSPAGTQWQADFLAACNGCSISAIGGHYYGTDGNDFINHFSGWHGQFNMDIYVTEFACQDFSGNNEQCSPGQISGFMGQVVGWMDSQPYIKGYAPFGFMTPSEVEANQVNGDNALLSDNLALSPLGSQYFNS